MKRSLYSIAILFMLVSCTSQFNLSSNSHSKNVVTIGAYGDFSADKTPFSQSSQLGIRLAIEEFNQSRKVAGPEIQMIFIDTLGEEGRAAKAVEELVKEHNSLGIIGDSHSKHAIEGAIAAQKLGVPLITPGATAPEITELGDFIFRICFTDSLQGRAMAQFARSNLKLNNVLILVDQSSTYSKNLSQTFFREFTEQSGAIVKVLKYSESQLTSNSLMPKLKDLNFDGVFVPGYFNDVSRIAQQLKEHGIMVPLLGGDGWGSLEQARLSLDFPVAGYYSNHFSSLANSPQTSEFIKNFKTRFEREADAMAALAYDATHILLRTIANAKQGNLNGQYIRREISKIDQYRGVTGEISLNKRRDAEKSVYIMRVQGPHVSLIAQINP